MGLRIIVPLVSAPTPDVLSGFAYSRSATYARLINRIRELQDEFPDILIAKPFMEETDGDPRKPVGSERTTPYFSG
jgi:hypothetical protein